MLFDKNDLTKLRDLLPYGSASKIQGKLSKRNKTFSISYINQVLDPNDVKYNQMIIDVAFEVAQEIKEQAIHNKQRLAFLSEEF